MTTGRSSDMIGPWSLKEYLDFSRLLEEATTVPPMENQLNALAGPPYSGRATMLVYEHEKHHVEKYAARIKAHPIGRWFAKDGNYQRALKQLHKRTNQQASARLLSPRAPLMFLHIVSGCVGPFFAIKSGRWAPKVVSAAQRKKIATAALKLDELLSTAADTDYLLHERLRNLVGRMRSPHGVRHYGGQQAAERWYIDTLALRLISHLDLASPTMICTLLEVIGISRTARQVERRIDNVKEEIEQMKRGSTTSFETKTR